VLQFMTIGDQRYPLLTANDERVPVSVSLFNECYSTFSTRI